MPTTPPPPSDVLSVRLIYDVGGREWSVGFWLWHPSLPAADVAYLETLAGAVILSENDTILHLIHDGCTFRTCRLSIGGLIVEKSYDFAAGIWSGGQAQGMTVGLHWLTGEGRRSSAALTHLAAVPDAFIAENQRLSSVGYENLADRGGELLARLAAHPSPAGPNCQQVVLHRRDAAARLSGPYVAPVIGVRPTIVASTMGRRLDKRRGAPPL